MKSTTPDVVIVTSIDRTHHKYIVQAMELGCDVITEKPMTIDEVKAKEIVVATAAVILLLLEDLFGNKVEDPLHRAASHYDGLMSILTGIAANKSLKTGRAINIDSLIKF